MTQTDLPRERPSWKDAAWLPAACLIFVQLASGVREMPQQAFFVIFLQEQLGLARVTISSVVAGAQLIGMLTALVGGAAAARLGSKWVLALGLVLSGLASLSFQAREFWPAALLWWVGGAGLAFTTVGGSSYLTQAGARGSMGLLAAFFALSMTAGGAIGNPLAGVIIERFGYTVFSRVVVLMAGAILLVVALLMPRLDGAPAGPRPQGERWGGLWRTARQRNVRLLAAMRCLPTIFYGMLMVLIPLMINAVSGSKVLVAAYGTANLIVASSAQLLAGRAADRWGARGPTLVAYALLMLSGLGLAIGASWLWSLFVFGVLGIAAAWSLSTLMYVWVNDGLPKEGQPAAFGLLHAVWSLSMMTGSVLGGWFSAVQPGLPFLVGGLMLSGAFWLTRVYYRENPARKA